MNIIIDAMGGDNAPKEILLGAAAAVREYGVQITAVGRRRDIEACARENGIDMAGITVADASETIEMCDEPTAAIRGKKDSSMVVGLRMLAAGEGDAFVSAGSTGALLAGATLIVKRLRGVKRPAIGTVIPAAKQPYLLLDSGANVECRPEMLSAFATMGSVYMEKVMGRANPSVGLVNNGAEETKGTPAYVEAHRLLKYNKNIRFAGNVEPKDVPQGNVDVVVCDGFTGNVILKLTEGVAKMLVGEIKNVFMADLKSKLAYLMVKGGMKDFKEKAGRRRTRRRADDGRDEARHQGPRLVQCKGVQKRRPAGKAVRGKRRGGEHARKAGRRGPDRGSRGVTAAGKARAARFRKTAPAGRPPSATKEGSGTMRETHELEEALHHHFKNPALLVTALTHTSYANEAKHGVRHNERLEFLGDSVLSIVVAEYLFTHKNMPEGELTRMRASLVCEAALFEFAKQISLGDYLRLGRGEERGGGRCRPSILSDAFEAVIAALYLDGGMETARAFILPFVTGALTDAAAEEDYKTKLQEIVQQNPEERLRYVVTDESGPDHNKHFVVEVHLNSNCIGKGEGHSKKLAEQQAAKEALALMGY